MENKTIYFPTYSVAELHEVFETLVNQGKGHLKVYLEEESTFASPIANICVGIDVEGEEMVCFHYDEETPPNFQHLNRIKK